MLTVGVLSCIRADMFTVCSVFLRAAPPPFSLSPPFSVLPLLFFILLFNDVMEKADESLRNGMIYCRWHTHSLMLSFSLFLRSSTHSFHFCQKSTEILLCCFCLFSGSFAPALCLSLPPKLSDIYVVNFALFKATVVFAVFSVWSECVLWSLTSNNYVICMFIYIYTPTSASKHDGCKISKLYDGEK